MNFSEHTFHFLSSFILIQLFLCLQSHNKCDFQALYKTAEACNQITPIIRIDWNSLHILILSWFWCSASSFVYNSLQTSLPCCTVSLASQQSVLLGKHVAMVDDWCFESLTFEKFLTLNSRLPSALFLPALAVLCDHRLWWKWRSFLCHYADLGSDRGRQALCNQF